MYPPGNEPVERICRGEANFEGNGTIWVFIPFERAEEIFCRQLTAAQGKLSVRGPTFRMGLPRKAGHHVLRC